MNPPMRTPLTAIPVLAGFAAPAALLALAACGGGGSATTSGTTPDGGQGPVTTLAEFMLPQQLPRWARFTPVIQFGNELRAGGAPPPAPLRPRPRGGPRPPPR